jgi:metal-responsive CopG/Arc/MetJ family transcriptional regulator
MGEIIKFSKKRKKKKKPKKATESEKIFNDLIIESLEIHLKHCLVNGELKKAKTLEEIYQFLIEEQP